jgi:hypothetical protein
MSADLQSRLTELEAGADRLEIMEFYDSLPAVQIEQMIGSWRGSGLPRPYVRRVARAVRLAREAVRQPGGRPSFGFSRREGKALLDRSVPHSDVVADGPHRSGPRQAWGGIFPFVLEDVRDRQTQGSPAYDAISRRRLGDHDL